jgi:hypothetical protein
MVTIASADPDLLARLRRGQKVVAEEHDEIGEVLGVVVRAGATYVHVQRYGAGSDEIYVPTMAVERVVGNRVYLDLSGLDLLAAPWHEKP